MDTRQVEGSLARMRRSTTATFLDTWRFTRPGTAGTLDESTGVTTAPDGDVVYEGPGKLIAPTSTGGTDRRVDLSSTPLRHELELPVAGAQLEYGDIGVIVSTRQPAVDGLTDRSWRVVATPADTWRLKRTVIVEEVVGHG